MRARGGGLVSDTRDGAFRRNPCWVYLGPTRRASPTNPRGAQLIFTTHDATLLGKEVLDRPLGRDQVWVTAKRRSGETELYPLSEAKPRKEENLERGYLRGRYGGVPRVTAGEIARELSWPETKATA